MRRADRVTQFAIAAAEQALASGRRRSPAIPLRRGVLIATGIGGIGTLEEQITNFVHGGERKVSPFLVPMMMPNAPGAAVSMRHGWQGPCQTGEHRLRGEHPRAGRRRALDRLRAAATRCWPAARRRR